MKFKASSIIIERLGLSTGSEKYCSAISLTLGSISTTLIEDY